MKYFRMSYEEVVFRRSFINIMLLNRSIPSYDYDKDDTEDNHAQPSSRHKKQKRAQRQKPMHSSEFFMQFM